MARRPLHPTARRHRAGHGTPVGTQAFTLRANLATQFHPEVTPDILATWLALGGQDAVDDAASVGTSTQELLATAHDQRDRARRDVDALLEWWLPTVGLG